MSADVLQEVTKAIQLLIHSVVGGASPDASCHVGPIDRMSTAQPQVSLFLFHVEPNREMRNAPRIKPRALDPADLAADRPLLSQESLALDLRYLISFNTSAVAGASTEDLGIMGSVLATLQGHPTMRAPLLTDQEVRLTPEPYPMEEMSRVWGLFPNANYRTSIVYLASPVFIDARAIEPAGRISSRRMDAGHAIEPPDFRRASA